MSGYSPAPTMSRIRRTCAARSAASCSAKLRPAAPASSALISTTASRRAARTCAARSSTARVRLSHGYDGVGQPDPGRLGGADPAPGHADLQRPGVPDEFHQPLGPAQVGHQSQRHLGHRELGVLGEHPQVAGERELEAGADRMPAHGGDASPCRVGAARRTPPGNRAIRASASSPGRLAMLRKAELVRRRPGRRSGRRDRARRRRPAPRRGPRPPGCRRAVRGRRSAAAPTSRESVHSGRGAGTTSPSRPARHGPGEPRTQSPGHPCLRSQRDPFRSTVIPPNYAAFLRRRAPPR